MYYSQSIEEYNISIFRLFIQRTLEGFEGYQKEISEVISEAKDLLQGKRTIYDIDKESYALVIFLKNHDANGFLNNIDPNNINNTEYKSLLGIFDIQEQYSSAECMHNY